MGLATHLPQDGERDAVIPVYGSNQTRSPSTNPFNRSEEGTYGNGAGLKENAHEKITFFEGGEGVATVNICDYDFGD